MADKKKRTRKKLVKKSSHPSNSKRPIRKNNKIKRRRQINRSFTVILSLLILVFIVYSLGKLVSLSSKTKIDPMVLEKVGIKKSDSYEGVIIRDEKVYLSDKAGYLSYNVKEDDKIKKAH